MRIVVTGAAGFVGRALVRRLADRHDVIGIDTVAAASVVAGDLGDPALLQHVFAGGCDAVVHLATVPGGAAEQNPVEAKRVNVDATMALIDAAAAAGTRPRFVFASSIAVFGDALPPAVDDTTTVAPKMIYGAQKAMMETWVTAQSRRGAIDGVSLRLPGIVARPAGPSGMKSAFMSDIFHALAAGRPFVAPVSADATMWLMSVDRIAANLDHALDPGTGGGAVTLPALRVRFGDLAAAIARATGAGPALVTYAPDTALQAAFGNQPLLATPDAYSRGFAYDGDLDALVASALATLSR